MTLISIDIQKNLVAGMVDNIELYYDTQNISYPLHFVDFIDEDYCNLFLLIEKEFKRKKIKRITRNVITRDFPNFNLTVFDDLPKYDLEENFYVALEQFQLVKSTDKIKSYVDMVSLSVDNPNFEHYTSEELDELILKFKKEINEILPISQIMDLRSAPIKERLSKRQDPSKYSRIPSFLGEFEMEEEGVKSQADFDEVALGSFFRDEIVVIGGLSGSGKTSLSIQCAVKQAEAGFRVAYLTFEQSEEAIIDKVLGVIEGKSFIHYEKLRMTDTEEEFEREKAKKVMTLFTYLGENLIVSYSKPNPQEFKTVLAQLCSMVDIIYIDNWQNISFERSGNTLNEFEKLSDECSAIIKDTGTVLVLLSQVTVPNGNWDASYPKGANKLKEDAGTFLLVYKEEQKYPPKFKKNDDDDEPKMIKPPTMWIDIMKNRKFDSGTNMKDIKFPYDTKRCRIGSFRLPPLSVKLEQIKNRAEEDVEFNEQLIKYQNQLNPFDRLDFERNL